ncbi:hypothetical protein DYY65_10920 [Nitrososphaera sp. AFS]|nr:hypothetical protein [Nitrososphaera sp. AFS]
MVADSMSNISGCGMNESVVIERFHLEVELDDDKARRVQAVFMANDMTIKQFAEYARVKEHY